MSGAEALAGFFSGIINDTILYHSDNCKYLLQNKAEIRPLKSYADFKYHFRGAPAIIFGGGLSYATFFYTYGLCKTELEPRVAQKVDQNSAFGKFVLAGLSGGCAIIPGTLIGYPFDQCKKSIASLPQLSASAVVHKIWDERGVRGFYQGWSYTMLRDIIMSALKMSVFEAACKFAYNTRSHPYYPSWLRGDQQNYQSAKTTTSTLEAASLSPREVSCVGLFSGIATAILSMPIDNIVTAVRSPSTAHEHKKSVVTLVRYLIERDGSYITPFFRGTTLRTLNYGAGSLVFWSAFNSIQQKVEPLFRKSGNNNNNNNDVKITAKD